MDECFPTSLFLFEEQSSLNMFISWLTHAYSVVYQQYKSSRIIHSFIIIFIQQKLPVNNMCLEILYWTAECKLAGHAFFFSFYSFFEAKRLTCFFRSFCVCFHSLMVISSLRVIYWTMLWRVRCESTDQLLQPRLRESSCCELGLKTSITISSDRIKISRTLPAAVLFLSWGHHCFTWLTGINVQQE